MSAATSSPTARGSTRTSYPAITPPAVSRSRRAYALARETLTRRARSATEVRASCCRTRRMRRSASSTAARRPPGTAPGRDGSFIRATPDGRSSWNLPTSWTNRERGRIVTDMTRVVEAAPSAPERSRPGRTVVLDGSGLTLDDVTAVARDGARVVLSDDPRVRAPMAASRALRDDALRRGIPIYGVTTGFGDSVHRQIAPGKARELQAHLVRNLGCGTGALAPVDVARATVLIRANSLARGHSGVRVELVERL